ncbi:MAG: restriction endonuclease [Acholeplasmataceae bacterium]
MSNEVSNKSTKIEKFDSKQIKEWLLIIVSKGAIDRSPLILECISYFGLTKEELKNKSSDSVLTKAKSRIGSVLAKLLNDGDFILDSSKIKLNKKIQEIIKEDELGQSIIEILSHQGVKTKKQVFDLVAKKVDSLKQGRDLKDIRSLSGNALTNLVKIGTVIKNEILFSVSKDNEFSNTEIGKCLKNAQTSDDIFPFLIDAFNIKGGEFFEEYSVKLIEKCLLKNVTINSSKVTGGPTDDGIDGIITCIDYLGYKETIFVQARVRNKGSITLKEVREFFGSLCAEKGTKGIFITNTTFHSEAKKFIDKQNILIGIDGRKLFEHAKDVQYGVIKKGTIISLDSNVFIN